MKQTLRLGCFETNSSSMHSLVVMKKEEYEKFNTGDLVYDKDSGIFVSSNSKAVKDYLEENELESVRDDDGDYARFVGPYNSDVEVYEGLQENGKDVTVVSIYVAG